MPSAAGLGGDLNWALDRIDIPVAAVDRDGRICYQNDRARTVFGDMIGRPHSDMIAPQSKASARLDLAKRVLGRQRTGSWEGWIRTVSGDVLADVHRVAIEANGHVVGVFGIAAPRREPGHEARGASQPLTPRQMEVLEYLARAESTVRIAGELSIAEETVRNHIRAILRALGVHSRLEAVLEAQRLGLVRRDSSAMPDSAHEHKSRLLRDSHSAKSSG